MRLNPHHPSSTSLIWDHPVLPAAYVRLGRLDDARRHAQAILEADPNYNLHDFARLQPSRNSADLKRYLKDLRAAGLPE